MAGVNGAYAFVDVDDTIIEVHGPSKQGAGFGYPRAPDLLGPSAPILVRMDSAYYGRDAIHAAITGGAHVSVTVRATSPVKTAIAGIGNDAWTTIQYPNAILDEATGTWISKAEVAEVPFTVFASKKEADHVPGRLVVRRIPDVHADTKSPPTALTAGTRSSSRSTPT